MKRTVFKGQTTQSGVAAVEFSLVAMIFFTVVFATLELARVEFMFNTLEEVTRRAAAAAANVDYTDATAMKQVQANAVFRNASGPLALGDPVTADNVKIDYLSVSNATWDLTHMSTLPACPAANRSNCMTNPDGDNCIRFVRARVCESVDGAGNCTPMSYQMMFPFFNLSGMKVPTSETIVPVGNLGGTAGSSPSCT
ncbi:TadE-like protein [Massilia sp. PDC64]|nr:TadE family protein [Massilia sp. PDC64]SDD14141.1 TadE-like protein [Massilia sp. PDC64]